VVRRFRVGVGGGARVVLCVWGLVGFGFGVLTGRLRVRNLRKVEENR